MEIRKKLSALRALTGKSEKEPNPLQEIVSKPENYRLEAYLEDGELVIRVKPKEQKPEERKIIGYRLKEG